MSKIMFDGKTPSLNAGGAIFWFARSVCNFSFCKNQV